MQDRQLRCSHRKFLASAAALTLAGGVAAKSSDARPEVKGRKPLAVLTTVYRPLSHSYHIAGRFLHGYIRHGEQHLPKHYIHSLYVDQTPDNDLSKDVARDFGVRIARNIADALVVDGKLAVDGILLIAEHGNYPPTTRARFSIRAGVHGADRRRFQKDGSERAGLQRQASVVHRRSAPKMVGWSNDLKFP